jgi:hypothetical protein
MPAKVTIGDMNGLFAQVNRRARYAMSPQNGELLMAVSSRNWAEARTLLSNARNIAATTLSTAPSFNEIRKELAISYEGLANAAAAQQGSNGSDVRRLLEKSATTWARGVRPQRGRPPGARSQRSCGEATDVASPLTLVGSGSP